MLVVFALMMLAMVWLAKQEMHFSSGHEWPRATLVVTGFVILSGVGLFVARIACGPRLTFRLQTALLAVLVLALWFRIANQLFGLDDFAEYRRQRLAAERLQKAGAWVAWQDWRVAGVTFVKSKLGEGELNALREFSDIKRIQVYETSIDDAALDYLSQRHSLESLTLSGASISDSDLARLKSLTALQQLSLSNTGISDAGLVHLAGMSKLTILNLNGTSVTDRGLDQLESLRNLKRLFVYGTSVSKAGARQLRRKLPDCKVYVDDGKGGAWSRYGEQSDDFVCAVSASPRDAHADRRAGEESRVDISRSEMTTLRRHLAEKL